MDWTQWTDQLLELDRQLTQAGYAGGWQVRFLTGSKSTNSVYFDAVSECPCQKGEDCNGCSNGEVRMRIRVSDHPSIHRQEHYSLVIPPGDPKTGDRLEDVLRVLSRAP